MTLIVSPETEARLQIIATQRGLRPEVALDILVHEALDSGTYAVTPLSGARRPMPVYDPTALVAILDAFNAGDVIEQQRTLEHLQVALDQNRPGQRRIFGAGTNPLPLLDEVA